MEAEARQKILWCALFACAVAGPYLLGARGAVEELPSSGTYALVALGMLAGVWATQYPGAAALLRRPEVWRPCVYGGLALAAFLSALNLLALWLPSIPNPSYQGEPGGLTPALRGLAGAVGPCEGWLAFAAALVCGAASTRFAGGARGTSPSPRDGAVRCLALAGAFLAGLLRSTAYGALLPAPLGTLLLWGILFEWSRWLARCGGMRGAVAALCLGELAGRVAARLGLPVPLAGPGPEGLALLVSVACLAAGAAASLRLQNRAAAGVRDGDAADGPGAGGLQPWELERLSGAGLTARELDVLAASVDGCDSSEAARRLGLSPSTVRTYKGRICKRLGLGSFDQVLGARSAQMGLFGPTGTAKGNVPRAQTGFDVKSETGGRFAASAFLRLAGCLSLLLLLLMPFGVLPLFWNSTWTMAYACAAGILLSFVPALLRWMGLSFRPGPAGGGAASAAFLVCAAACLAVRLHVWAGAAGLGPSQRLALFAAVAGLVCFGLTALHSCVGSARLEGGRLGAACACAAGMAVVASFGTAFWLGAAALSLLGFAAGSALGKWGERQAVCSPDEHPSVAASWFAVAFLWEECWRGATYASLQDVGAPFLAALVLLDSLVLLRRKDGGRAACGAVLACTALLCLMRGIVFGLLVGTVLLEVQALRASSSTSYAHPENQKGSLPALPAAAVGCCAAVSVANAWGSYILLHAESSPPAGLGWLVPCCFAISLAVAVWRAVHAGLAFAFEGPGVDRAHLEGYLAGKGLTDTEAKVCVALARGASVAQIAEELSYSVSAAGAAKRSAFSKLGVATRYQYVASLWRELEPRRGTEELTNRKNTR